MPSPGRNWSPATARIGPTATAVAAILADATRLEKLDRHNQEALHREFLDLIMNPARSSPRDRVLTPKNFYDLQPETSAFLLCNLPPAVAVAEHRRKTSSYRRSNDFDGAAINVKREV
ncbi:glucose-6-phosphate isomerase [Striga asiatica]|uniref:Glucose-6-phosphate isomerase n=1 Tax=Striga asiatica TaxID=4170 RepID=A0A5A7RAR3_STRAF|nr:glucose-6-phosphate isomerase [Striga asiatica]